MIIKLGTESDAPSINLLQACFWFALRVDDNQAIYRIAFPGMTILDLTKEQSAAFDQFLRRKAEPSRIQPLSNGGIILT